MRGLARRRAREDEEEESAFVSMTDMTVSVLFIVILLLAFFASQYSPDEAVSRDLYQQTRDQRDQAEAARDAMQAELDALRPRLAQVIEARDEALRELARLRREVVMLEETVETRDRRILVLESRLAALRTTLETLRARIAELQRLLSWENPLELYGAKATEVRRQMLERLASAVRDDIDRQSIEGLTVSAQGDALRFQGRGLFASNARSLTGESLRIVRLLGEHLDRELPCYSVGPRSTITRACNPDLALFETIQIEGHTDSEGPNAYNLGLSADRALSAFTAIAPDRSGEGSRMLGYENLLGQPLLAFAGYGEMRPIVDEAAGDRSANRRIDLRFIMYVPPGVEFIPETIDDLARVRERLRRRAAVE